MKRIEIEGLDSEALRQMLADVLKVELKDLAKLLQPVPDEYLTTKEVMDLLKVSAITIHRWSKAGKLKPFGIGHRVYFKKSDIDACLTPLTI